MAAACFFEDCSNYLEIKELLRHFSLIPTALHDSEQTCTGAYRRGMQHSPTIFTAWNSPQMP
jgi:hypothetical protein